MRYKCNIIPKKIATGFLLLLLFSVAGQGQELTATTDSRAVNAPIYTLFIFTGSDWCTNCRRLEKKVLSEPAFTESMRKNGIEIRIIDFPQRKKPDPEILKYNQSIADSYHFEGIYPTLVLAKRDSKLYRLFFYKNQGWDEFSAVILEHKEKMNE